MFKKINPTVIITFICVGFLSVLSPFTEPIWIFVLSALFSLVNFLIAKKHIKIMPSVIILVFGIINLILPITQNEIKELPKDIVIKAIVKTEKRITMNFYDYYELEALGYYDKGLFYELNGERIMAYFAEDSGHETGDLIDCKASVFKSEITPKEDLLLYSKGISSVAYISEIINTESGYEKNINYYLTNIMRGLSANIDKNLKDENASIAKAIALGNKSDLTYDISNAFKMSGVSHILVVSGLHMSVIATVILTFLNMFALRSKTKSLISIILIITYMLIVGFTGATVRSGIMLIIFYLASIFGKRSNTLNSLLVAMTLILLTGRYVIYDIGLLLSFTSTLGIVLFSTKIKNLIYRGDNVVLGFVTETAASTVSAILATFPLSALYFDGICIMSVLTNLLITPLLFFVTLFVIILSIFGGVPIVSEIFTFLSNIIISYMYSVVKTISKIPYFYYGYDNYTVLNILTLASFVIILLMFIENKKILLTSILSVLILVTGCIIFYNSNKSDQLIINKTENEVMIWDKSYKTLVIDERKADYWKTINNITQNNFRVVDRLIILNNREFGFKDKIVYKDIVVNPQYEYVINEDIVVFNNKVYYKHEEVI